MLGGEGGGDGWRWAAGRLGTQRSLGSHSKVLPLPGGAAVPGPPQRLPGELPPRPGHPKIAPSARAGSAFWGVRGA
eukprot:3273731-Alexandrium_andersonii.AAC.1